jgi:hypothetical protein
VEIEEDVGVGEGGGNGEEEEDVPDIGGPDVVEDTSEDEGQDGELGPRG